MSVVRGRPPGLAGGISGTRRADCPSLRACPAPKSPTIARVSAVHMVRLREGLLLPEPPTFPLRAPVHPSRVRFSNGLLAFVAGFSIDIVFSLIERIISAFDNKK